MSSEIPIEIISRCSVRVTINEDEKKDKREPGARKLHFGKRDELLLLILGLTLEPSIQIARIWRG